MNIKGKALRLAAAGAIAFAAAATVGASPAFAMGPGEPCTHGGLSGLCTIMDGPETLWEPNNTVNRTINVNDQVEVECWYTGGGPGTPKDGIWDHIVWTERSGATSGSLVQGHIDDNLVDFSGFTPGEKGLPHCG
jgi:hypothetical protein